MATVITNLLSAIPFFGQDLVELNYKFYTELNKILNINAIDIYITNITVLPAIGKITTQALKKGRKLRLDKSEYLSLPSQFIYFLVGLIDGDGYIQIVKTTKGFIAIKLIIALHLNDLSTLEYINSVLKIGKITINKDIKNPICKLIINKTDLQEIIFPLLIHHYIFFLTTNRRAQFDLALYILQKDIKHFKDIPNFEKIPTFFNLPKKAEEYLQLNFFKNWLVGFTNAEGSFFIKKNKDGCFQLKQKIHTDLFNAFKLLFDTQRKIIIEKEKYLQFSVSSKTDIQKVINFFSFSGLHPLVGLKNIQYLKWLTDLKNSDRYANLKFPN